MERGTWKATFHRVAQSRISLNQLNSSNLVTTGVRKSGLLDQIQTAVSIQLQSENGLLVFKWFKKKGGVGGKNISWYVKSI